LYRQLAEYSVDFIYVIDRDFRVRYVNRSGAGALGMGPEDATGKHLKDLFPPDTAEKMMNGLSRAFESGKPQSDEMTHHFFQGDFHIHVSLNPIFDDNGNVGFVMGISRDINELKRTEQALRKSEEKFRVLAETSPAAICLFQDDKLVYYNPSAERFTGYTGKELSKLTLMDLLCPDDRDAFKGYCLLNRTEGSSQLRYEMNLRAKSGEDRCCDISVGFIDYEGKPAVILTAFDLTERKRAEEALLESEEKFRLLADFTYDWESWIDPNGNYIYISPSCERITGYCTGDFYRDPGLVIKLVHPDDRVAYENHINVYRKNANENGSIDFRIVTSSGKTRWISHLCQPVFSSKGEWLGRRSSNRDITDRMMVEEELMAAKLQAELYLDLMGHDINNLHQIALGYLELARDMPACEEQTKFLGKPVEVLQRSAKLISNVRKLQKLRDGMFQDQEMDVCKVLSDVQREFAATPNKKIMLSLNGFEHCHVLANELLYDVFANLVGNAVKHTGDRVDIVVDLDVVKDNSGMYCRVIVEDDGLGIPDDFKATIFNRASKGTARAKGMGLGLYLVKSLVDSYGGKVWVEDRIMGDHTKGARFVVLLPAAE
jgi:PAS domain S-box-containing protein